MTDTDSLQPDPTKIGEVSAPPFAVLPNPEALFERREERLRLLSKGHTLAPYLTFVADVAHAQRGTLIGLPQVSTPIPEELARAREFQMPPIDRAGLPADPVFRQTLERFLDAAQAIDMPDASRLALETLRAADTARRETLAHELSEPAAPYADLAQSVLVAAALQIHMARLASKLDAAALVSVGDGLCPVCGGRPCATMVVGWHGAHGSRFCACAMCGALWNYVRIRCVACGETKGISYKALDDGDGAIKAECCAECGSYVKIFQQTQEPNIEPVADDIASLGLDMRLRDENFRRAGFNPFLLGY